LPQLDDVEANVPRVDAAYWDGVWSDADRRLLPNFLNVGNRNLRSVLSRSLEGCHRVLEVGCAPGKWLAWLGRRGHEVAGLDFAPGGVESTRRRLAAAGVRGDVRCEDLFATSFEPAAFDAVYSAGVVEHFDDPRPCLARHLALVRPGGRVVVLIPHYGGIYGSIQGWLDREKLDIHNLSIMSPEAMASAMRDAGGASVVAWSCGRASPWILTLEERMPRAIARVASLGLNALALLQPCEVRALRPLIAVTAIRPPSG